MHVKWAQVMFFNSYLKYSAGVQNTENPRKSMGVKNHAYRLFQNAKKQISFDFLMPLSHRLIFFYPDC